MNPQQIFYLVETGAIIVWVVVVYGLIMLTVDDLMEYHDLDYVFYRRHWRLILISYAALFFGLYLDKVLRTMQHAIWNR